MIALSLRSAAMPTPPELKTMRRTDVPSYFRPRFLSVLLAASIPSTIAATVGYAPALHAQGPGQDSYLCDYHGQKDGHPIKYVTPILKESTLGHLPDRFYAYMRTTYDLSKIQYGVPGCERISNDAAGQANTMDMMQKQWTASKTEVIHLTWTDSPAEAAAADAAAAQAAAAAPRASTGGPFISCSTQGGGGVTIYVTGIFQTTKPVRYLPNGWKIVDQSVLDDFYAYLKEKGYNFKPGSNEGCDVSPTEAAAETAQHTRIHGGGGGCGYCGNKVVETGWKE
jgi:hypothetical protein